MKKLFVLLLAMALVLSICACAPVTDSNIPTTTGSSSLENSGNTEGSGEVNTSTPSSESTGIPGDTSTQEPPTETVTPPTETVTPPTETVTPPTDAPQINERGYNKVNISSASDITEGVYLLGGTSAYATDNGSTYSFLTGIFDSKGTRLTCADLTVNGISVENGDSTVAWKLTKTTGGFFVQNLGSGKYLYYGDNTGNAIFMTDKKSEAGVWKVVSHDDAWTLEEVASGRQLSVNAFGSAGNKYLGAAAYVSTGSTKRSLDFYKLGAEGTVPQPTEKPTETPTEKPTEKPTEAPTEKPTTGSDGEITYVLNTNTKKFHKPDCSSANKMSEKNKAYTDKSKEELEADGYTGCGICKP